MMLPQETTQDDFTRIRYSLIVPGRITGIAKKKVSVSTPKLPLLRPLLTHVVRSKV